MNQILVHEEGSYALVRIVGRGSFKNSETLHDYGNTLLQTLHEDSHLLLDMKDCQGLDSTFMGMLASWTHALIKAGKPGPIMLDVQSNVAECITTLGLSHVIAWSPMGESPIPFRREVDACKKWQELESEEETNLDTAHHMFVAHEALVDLKKENRGRFKDVLNYLGQKLGKHKNSDEI